MGSLYDDLGKLVKKEGVKWITFGQNGSYIFEDASGVMHWWNIPDGLEKELKSRWKSQIVSISLGQFPNSYVAIFDDYKYWSKIPDDLATMLKSSKVRKDTVHSFDKVWLSSYDSKYY